MQTYTDEAHLPDHWSTPDFEFESPYAARAKEVVAAFMDDQDYVEYVEGVDFEGDDGNFRQGVRYWLKKLDFPFGCKTKTVEGVGHVIFWRSGAIEPYKTR